MGHVRSDRLLARKRRFEAVEQSVEAIDDRFKFARRVAWFKAICKIGFADCRDLGCNVPQWPEAAPDEPRQYGHGREYRTGAATHKEQPEPAKCPVDWGRLTSDHKRYDKPFAGVVLTKPMTVVVVVVIFLILNLQAWNEGHFQKAAWSTVWEIHRSIGGRVG